MGEHTPTPWVTGKGLDVSRSMNLMIYCDDLAGSRVADLSAPGCLINAEQCQANAAFIVRAANAHEALVSALEALLEAVNESPWVREREFYNERSAANAALKLARDQ